MPIKVTCACGQSFAAKDELAGRTVKCPKCSRPLAIPAAGAGAAMPAAATQPMPQRPAMPQQPLAAAPAAHSAGGLFDEIGISAAPAGTTPCPGCRAPMPIGAILCVQCGYNLQLGRRMETMRIGADGQVGHTSVVDSILSKAARAIQEEKEEERKKVREGIPWWGYLLMLMSLVGFLAMMMLIPQGTAVLVAAGVLMFAGWLLCLYSGICLLIIAFKESPLQGILYLLVPFYALIFIIMRWEKCSGFFFMNLGGAAIMGAGWGVAIIGAIMVGDDSDVRLPKPREVMVAELERPNRLQSTEPL